MKIHYPYVLYALRVMIVFLFISLPAMAYNTKTSPRSYSQQKQQKAPEWLQIFEKQDQQKQKFKPATVHAHSATSQLNNSTNLPPIGYRNSLLEQKQQIRISHSASSTMPLTQLSSPMHITETNRATINRKNTSGAGNIGIITGLTVYEPFGTNVPSDYAEGVGDLSIQMSSGPRKSFPERPDTPPANTSPIGEPWILLFFGLIFAVGATIRKKTKSNRSI